MKISYYDSPTTAYAKDYCVSYIIQPIIILFDSLQFSVDNEWARIILEDMDTWSQDKCVEVFKDCFSYSKSAMAMVELYNQIAPFIKKTSAKKQKDKETLVSLGTINNMNRKFKDDLKGYANLLIEDNNLKGVLPFQNEGIFIMKPFDYQQKNNKEDVLIAEISMRLSTRDHIVSFDKCVEQLYSFSHYEEVENNTSDFIKIPLWDLPMLDEFDYKQLKYTRDDLHPALAPFKMQLKQLSDEIFPLQFIDENIEQLKYLCQSQLQKFVQPIQHSIDESIYISQTRNKSQAWNKLTLNLGITSVENLIQYYEKVETVEPYVANEIKRQTARYLDLKASCFFMYFEQHIIQADAI